MRTFLGQSRIAQCGRSVDSYLIESLSRRGVPRYQIEEALRIHRTRIEKRDLLIKVERDAMIDEESINGCVNDHGVRHSELHPFGQECFLLGGARKKRGPTRGPGGRRTAKNSAQSGGVSVPRNQSAFAPLFLINTMKYTDENISKTNAGNQYVYWRMRMGDLFDPNPLIVTNGIAGFASCATMFRRYIAFECELNLEIVNNEAFPVCVYVAPSDIDLAAQIVSGLTANNLGEYPHAKKCILGANGGMNRAKLRLKINLPNFVGQRGAYMNSLDYSALVTASPAIQTFMNIALSSAINFTAAGVTQLCTYTYRCKWTERQTPDS